jgi:hypothetical protein
MASQAALGIHSNSSAYRNINQKEIEIDALTRNMVSLKNRENSCR